MNSVQHAIRAAVADESIGAAELTVGQFLTYERDHLTPDLDRFKKELAQSDQYVRESLRPHVQRMEGELNDREEWYQKLLDGDWGTSISDVQDKARRLQRSFGSVITVVISTDTSIETPDWVDQTLTPDEIHMSPKEFGYDLPHAFMAVRNSDKGSIYPLVPWYGTIVCTCYGKQNKAYMPCCKHEVFAANHLSRDTHTVTKQLPERYRRIVSPKGTRLRTDMQENQ